MKKRAIIVLLVAASFVCAGVATRVKYNRIQTSKALVCQENLSKIEGAKEQYALEFKLSNGTPIDMDQLITHAMRAMSAPRADVVMMIPKCPSGGIYVANPLGSQPTCSIGNNNGRFPPHVTPR